ncbi:MAG: YdeI/OmpD-associated family protein [Terracidiphilus sp.]
MTSSPPKSFTAVLEPLRSGLGWVIARIPFDVAKAWPKRRGLRVRGEIRSVDGNIGAFAFRTSLFAASGGQGHFLLVNKKMQAASKATVGSRVRISLEPDLEERTAATPPELARALKGDRRLTKWFAGMSYSMRKEIGKWVSEPKSAASREKRAEAMAERLLLTLEGETELPPILHAAFLRQPLARKGWETMTPTQRRGHLLGIFYYQTVEARERRATKVIEEALRVARRDSDAAR